MLLLIILEVWILEHMPLKKYFFSLRLIGKLLFPFFERQNRALLIILSFQFIPCKINIEEFYIPGIGNGNPLQYSCLQIPWTEEHGRLQFMGVTKESDTTEQLSKRIVMITLILYSTKMLTLRALRSQQIKKKFEFVFIVLLVNLIEFL